MKPQKWRHKPSQILYAARILCELSPDLWRHFYGLKIV